LFCVSGEGIKEGKKFRVKFVSETTSFNLFLQEAREYGEQKENILRRNAKRGRCNVSKI
jgi:hypothetical protein